MRSLLVLLFALLFSFTLYAQTGKFPELPGSKPIVLGAAIELKSKVLGETRTLNIYLPADYDPRADTVRYPVVYLLDGGLDEDFIHVAGLIQFNTFPWVNIMPQSILVGIANTDRKRDLTYPTTIPADKKNYPSAGHSDKFISFLQNELKPYVDRQFNTNKTSTLIGESLGGLLVTEILLNHPPLFDNYIIISPSLWWDNGSLLNKSSTILKADYKGHTSVYIGVGKEGLTPGENPRVMEVDANLLADKLKGSKAAGLKCYFDYLPLEDHATIAHQALYNAFRMLYSKQ